MKIPYSVDVIDEIRMVYDATKSGLNESVWSSWVSLPTVESELRAMKVGTFMCDCDVGKMFLNFMIDPRLRPRAGVDLFRLYPEKAVGKSKSVKAQWERMMMEFAPPCILLQKIFWWLK